MLKFIFMMIFICPIFFMNGLFWMVQNLLFIVTFVFILFSNVAAPPSLNLLGEILLLNSIVWWSWFTMISLSLLSFFSAAYTLYLCAYSQHGKVFSGVYSFSGGKIRKYILLMLHWFPLNVLILKSDIFLLWL